MSPETRVQLRPKCGTVERIEEVRLGRTKKDALLIPVYVVRWDDGTVDRYRADDIEEIEE